MWMFVLLYREELRGECGRYVHGTNYKEKTTFCKLGV